MSTEPAPQRLDYYDALPAAPETTTVPAEPTAPADTQPAQADDKAGLTAEDLALIEFPEADEAEAAEAETDEPAEADEPAEDEEAEVEADDTDNVSEEDDAAPETEDEDGTVPTLRPPEDASEEELAEWRKAAGVPATAEEYLPGEVDGHEWGEDDEPALKAFHDAAHGLNLPQDAAAGITSWYAEQMQAARDRDATQRDTASAELSQEWGDDYKPNMTAYRALFKEGSPLPEDLTSALAGARTRTGERLVNLPGFVRLMVGFATSETAKTMTPETARAAETAELRQLMETDIGSYQSGTWRNTGKAPWARALELARAAEADGKKAPTPIETVSGLRAELAEITTLMNTDIDRYQNRPWKGSGKTASQRSLEIQRQLAGERAA